MSYSIWVYYSNWLDKWKRCYFIFSQSTAMLARHYGQCLSEKMTWYYSCSGLDSHEKLKLAGKHPPNTIEYIEHYFSLYFGLSHGNRRGNNGISWYPRYQIIFWLTENFNQDYRHFDANINLLGQVWLFCCKNGFEGFLFCSKISHWNCKQCFSPSRHG